MHLYIALIVFLICAYIWPVIGLAALVCMLAPVILAIFQGRLWCGNFCPRGQFYNLFSKLSKGITAPKWLTSKKARLAILVGIMAVFAVRVLVVWPNVVAIGRIFWQMVLVTTLVGIFMAYRYTARAWCMICPMGTLASLVSDMRQNPGYKVTPVGRCVSCKKCTKACPMFLPVHEYAKDGRVVDHSDCIKCGECVAACPLNSLA